MAAPAAARIAGAGRSNPRGLARRPTRLLSLRLMVRRPWDSLQAGLPASRAAGTGKTTLVLAVAGELKLSVAVLSLSNRLMSDESLRSHGRRLAGRDAPLDRGRRLRLQGKPIDHGDTGVTLSGLLNALDGVSSREGRVLFLTTNHPERLDPALGSSRPRRSEDRAGARNARPGAPAVSLVLSRQRPDPVGPRPRGRSVRRAGSSRKGVHGRDPGTPAAPSSRARGRRS